MATRACPQPQGLLLACGARDLGRVPRPGGEPLADPRDGLRADLHAGEPGVAHLVQPGPGVSEFDRLQGWFQPGEGDELGHGIAFQGRGHVDVVSWLHAGDFACNFNLTSNAAQTVTR